MRRIIGLVVIAVGCSGVFAACVGDSTGTPTDGGQDATLDAPQDSSAEGATDGGGGNDGATDAPIDTGPEPVGQVDNTYANGAVTTAPIAINFATALAVDAQGRAYIVGNVNGCVSSNSSFDYMIIRLTAAGAVDTSFGTNGYRCVDFDTNDSDTAYAVAIDASGNVIVGGNSYASGNYASVVKLDSSGNVLWRWRYSTDASAQIVLGLVVSGTRIYAVGSNNVVNQNRSGAFIVALQASNGTLDTSFDNTGVVIDATAYAYFAGAPGPASTLYVSGGTVGANRKFYVRRFTGQGVYDNTFGTTNGAVSIQTSASGYDSAIALQVQSNGDVLAAGPSASKVTATYASSAVARFTSTGSGLDSTFASGSGKPGVYFSPLEWLDNDTGEVGGLVLEPSGMMIVGGGYSLQTDGGSPRDVALTHLKADGTVDTAFGQSGIARANNTQPYFVEVVRDPSTAKFIVLAFDGSKPFVYRFD